MYVLNEGDYKKIKLYKKSKREDIALYFFDKFRNDVIDIVFYKINKKFSYIPFEKGDIYHLLWNSVKKTLLDFKKEENFNSCLVNNCYFLTVKEIRKFINNSELVMNISSSLDQHMKKYWLINDKNNTSRIEIPRNVMLNNLINEACEYVTQYKNDTVRKVIYLKSLGYSITEIASDLDINRYYVEDIIKKVEKIAKRLFC